MASSAGPSPPRLAPLCEICPSGTPGAHSAPLPAWSRQCQRLPGPTGSSSAIKWGFPLCELMIDDRKSVGGCAADGSTEGRVRGLKLQRCEAGCLVPSLPVQPHSTPALLCGRRLHRPHSRPTWPHTLSVSPELPCAAPSSSNRLNMFAGSPSALHRAPRLQARGCGEP